MIDQDSDYTVTLTFVIPQNLDNLLLALSANDLVGVIQEFDEYLRMRIKYREEDDTEITKALEVARDMLSDICDFHGVDPWG